MSLFVKEGVPLAPYTIYKIGGPARFFVEARNAQDAREAVEFAATNVIPFFILGAGSNVLVSDRGFDGLVIRMTGGEVRVDGCELTVDAGVMMARAVLESAKAGLTGFEWGIGVPGTLGGSVRGNAGCFGGEMKDVIERICVLKIRNPKSEIRNKSKIQNPKQNIIEIRNSECGFGYRNSIFKKHPEWIILSATLKLERGDPAAVHQKIAEITAERTRKQDIGTQSCGCIFKNVPWERSDREREEILAKIPDAKQFSDRKNLPASFLIDRAGLKGRRAGMAVISPKHANFFVNENGASAEEVRELVALAKDAVREKFGIVLEEEIQYVGF